MTKQNSNIIINKHYLFACLAQSVEHAAVNRSVGGSSPSTGAIETTQTAWFLFLIEQWTRTIVRKKRTTASGRHCVTALDAICQRQKSLFRHFVPYGGSSPSTGAIETTQTAWFLFLIEQWTRTIVRKKRTTASGRHCVTALDAICQRQKSLFRHFVPYGGSSPPAGAIETTQTAWFFVLSSQINNILNK